jgi:hypothetical protein
MPTPEPNSPEARRAARKVRDIFFFIAVLNVVLIFVVMCTKRNPAAEPAKPPPANPAPNENQRPP